MNLQNTQPLIFQNKLIRRDWNEKQREWYFSVVNIIEVLTNNLRPRKYWNALKTKLHKQESQLFQNMGRLKLQSADGKWI